VNNDCAFSIDELFPKQTLRNRTVIVTSQGAKNLSVPVVRPFGAKTKMSEVKISYVEDWQKTHWKSIESAYRSSPFFEFFEEDLREFYNLKFEYLSELNIASHQLIASWLELKSVTLDEFNDGVSIDKRLADKNSSIDSKQYWQVFIDTVPFIQNASILDLVFCEGTNSLTFLK
jgi:hypothetical protein